MYFHPTTPPTVSVGCVLWLALNFSITRERVCERERERALSTSLYPPIYFLSHPCCRAAVVCVATDKVYSRSVDTIASCVGFGHCHCRFGGHTSSSGCETAQDACAVCLWLFFLFFSHKVQLCGYSLSVVSCMRVCVHICVFSHCLASVSFHDLFVRPVARRSVVLLKW